ncbi:MAG TPA: hypothetical protein VG498_15895 [Terriglobales bacterium]|nr:hypothetical protein [Terriglobales bacterium]
MRDFVICLALSFLSVLSFADSYQIDISANWISQSTTCGSNCAETINMNFSYVPDSNFSVDNNYGSMDLSTFQLSSSGFLDPLEPLTYSGNYVAIDGLAFRTATGNEVDLDNFGFGLNFPLSVPVRLFIYDCVTAECRAAYPDRPSSPAYIDATYLNVSVTPMPEGANSWELLLTSLLVCAFGFWRVHHNAERKKTAAAPSDHPL